jgi:Mrp family chromosome partitioning ATPase
VLKLFRKETQKMSEKNAKGKTPEDYGFHKKEDFHIDFNEQSSVKKVIGVVSGKGGVGKSFVTSLLACEMQRRGYRAAVLDGDITGPSQGKSFGIHEKATGQDNLIDPYVTKTGIQVISTNMILDHDDQPVIWRGPMVANVLKQFYQEVHWDNVDYMFVDMPPGTSDVPLTAFQSFKLDGIIIVTSPQELVSMVVEKAINMANMMNIRIYGLIENMSYAVCPNCGEKIMVFGHSHIQEIADKYQLEVLAKVPLDPRISEASDAGTIEDLKIDALAPAADFIEK